MAMILKSLHIEINNFFFFLVFHFADIIHAVIRNVYWFLNNFRKYLLLHFKNFIIEL